MDKESDEGFVFTRKRAIEQFNGNFKPTQSLPTPPSKEIHKNLKTQTKRTKIETVKNSSRPKMDNSSILSESSINLIKLDQITETSAAKVQSQIPQLPELSNISVPRVESSFQSNEGTSRRSSVGARRSSLLLRASRRSIFGFGEMGYPHPNISESDFYKHISAQMPEPSRMRTLLSWLLQRCIEFQVSTHKEELEISKKIQKVALEALNKHEIDTFWLRRPVDPEEEDRPHKLNPQNEENIAKKRQLEAANNKLRKEIEMWRKAASFQNSRHAACLDTVRGSPGMSRPDLDTLFTSEELDTLKPYKPVMDDKEIHDLLSAIPEGISEFEANLSSITQASDKLSEEISTLTKETAGIRDKVIHPRIANADPIKLVRCITRFKDKSDSTDELKSEEFKYGHSLYSRR